jgi:hypothetical protein
MVSAVIFDTWCHITVCLALVSFYVLCVLDYALVGPRISCWKMTMYTNFIVFKMMSCQLFFSLFTYLLLLLPVCLSSYCSKYHVFMQELLWTSSWYSLCCWYSEQRTRYDRTFSITMILSHLTYASC